MLLKTARLILLTVMLCLTAASAVQAASWAATRDAAMTMREKGNPTEAYKLVISVSTKGADFTDQQFLAGFLALRALNRPDVAIEHFKDMAGSVNALRKGEQSNRRSQAGYWLARALVAQGKTNEAAMMFSAAAAYRDTFYGQMAAKQVGLTNGKDVMKAYRPSYPDMDIFWHDPRIRRELVLAIIRAESSFKQGAVSGAGAKGLMQIMDGTALRTGRLAGVDIDLRQVATNSHYNVAVGSKIVGDLMEKYNGNVLLMAAGYNAGALKSDEWISRFGDPRGGVVDPVDWIELIPFRETREYVKKIVSNYVTYLSLSAAGV